VQYAACQSEVVKRTKVRRSQCSAVYCASKRTLEVTSKMNGMIGGNEGKGELQVVESPAGLQQDISLSPPHSASNPSLQRRQHLSLPSLPLRPSLLDRKHHNRILQAFCDPFFAAEVAGGGAEEEIIRGREE
jgi:hypothetical protein